MARPKRKYRAPPQTKGPPETGPQSAVRRPFNLRVHNGSIEKRWAPDIESELCETNPTRSAELEAIRHLFGGDLDRLLRE
jgi:hypothetical protein